MTTMQRTSAIIGFIVLVAAAIVVYFVLRSDFPSADSLAGRPDLIAVYEQALKEEKLTESDEKRSNPLHYLGAGLEWKSLGDLTGDKKWYEQALETYERGIENTNSRNTLLMANAAVLAENVGDYQKSKKLYEQALELSPGDASYYLSLAKLMRIRLNATPEEILAVYNQGVTRVVGSGEVVLSRGSYLLSIGRLDEAKADFDSLYKGGALSKAQYDEFISAIAEKKAAQK